MILPSRPKLLLQLKTAAIVGGRGAPVNRLGSAFRHGLMSESQIRIRNRCLCLLHDAGWIFSGQIGMEGYRFFEIGKRFLWLSRLNQQHP